MALTKHNFKSWKQCQLRAWHQLHSPKLVQVPTVVDQYRWRVGLEVHGLAQELFPEGIKVELEEGDFRQAVAQTEKLFDESDIKTIFEASFEVESCRLRCDILRRQDTNSWTLIEIKDSTRVKESHLLDIWYQYHLLQKLEIDLTDVQVLYLNKNYVFDGNSLNLHELFTSESVYEVIGQMETELTEEFEEFIDVTQGETTPNVSPSKHCKHKDADKECEFFSHCTTDKPKFWIYRLPRISEKKWKQLTDLGIEDISEIPEDFKLTPNQEIVRSTTVSRIPMLQDGLQEALDSFEFPCYFIDFETSNPAIPKYAGTRPYQQIPFQWSCHVLSEDGTQEHYEFLHDSNTDPQKPLAESLIDLLSSQGSIIHYSPFEKKVLSELSESLPEFSERIEALKIRLIDLKKILSDHYYEADFLGSYSIKKVLPVLCPTLSYDTLSIQEGSEAAIQYMNMLKLDTANEERVSIKEALLKYCKQDTLAMVEVWRKLKEIGSR